MLCTRNISWSISRVTYTLRNFHFLVSLRTYLYNLSGELSTNLTTHGSINPAVSKNRYILGNGTSFMIAAAIMCVDQLDTSNWNTFDLSTLSDQGDMCLLMQIDFVPHNNIYGQRVQSRFEDLTTAQYALPLRRWLECLYLHHLTERVRLSKLSILAYDHTYPCLFAIRTFHVNSTSHLWCCH